MAKINAAYNANQIGADEAEEYRRKVMSDNRYAAVILSYERLPQDPLKVWNDPATKRLLAGYAQAASGDTQRQVTRKNTGK